MEKFSILEIWRFFIERRRYLFVEQIKKHLLDSMDSIEFKKKNFSPELVANIEKDIGLKEGVNKLKRDDWEKVLSQITCKQLNEISNNCVGDTGDSLKWIFRSFLKYDANDETPLSDKLNRHKAWLGFEENESGYLKAMVTTFVKVLEVSQQEDVDLSLDLMDMIHKMSTEPVLQKLESKTTPGKMREQETVGWGISELDSEEGLAENIYYIMNNKISDITIYVNVGGLDQACLIGPGGTLAPKTMEECREVAKDIREKLNVNAYSFQIIQPKGEKNIVYLNRIINDHITTYKNEIKNAKSDKDKVGAIFKFLKYTVLHHPYKDGVGRSLSMLLLQFLLLKNNLTPAILLDSNHIPAKSVNEMVEEYMKVSKELENSYKNPEVFSSEKFAKQNINTLDFYHTLSEVDKSYFTNVVTIFNNYKEKFLHDIHTTKKNVIGV